MWCLKPGIERFNCQLSTTWQHVGGDFNNGLAVKVCSCNKFELFWKSIESFYHKKRSIDADMTPVLHLHLINQGSRSPFYLIKSQADPSQNLGEVNSVNWKHNFSLIAQASASMRGHKAVWKVIGSQIKEMWLFLDAESIQFNGDFVKILWSKILLNFANELQVSHHFQM